MTNVVIAGVTPTSLHFLRQSLGQPTIELVGLVTSEPDGVPYAVVNDSATTKFRGTAKLEGDSLVLAGRHGRGGLRHDHIPLFSQLGDALGNERTVDCVVVSEDWPDLGDDFSVPVVRLDRDIPEPVADIVARVGEVLSTVAPLTHLFVNTVGAANPGSTSRDQNWARRGDRAGKSSRVAERGSVTIEAQLVGADAERVAVCQLFGVFGETVAEDAVRRRLRSAGRNRLAECLVQEEGPVGTLDVLGSALSVLDLGSVSVTGDAVALTIFVDPLAVRTRLALAQVSGSLSPSTWQV